ncbi:MAG: Ca-activated chloride channel homolog [Thiomicrorhabdus sp.]|nr:MAG: Ca-activated chloride channel homolog [Thiomicrorhabdus sp.]
MDFDLMMVVNHLLSGELFWRDVNWLWALLLPLALWFFKKLGRKQQQQAYADANLWPWVAGSNSRLKSPVFITPKNTSEKMSRGGRLIYQLKSAINGLWNFVRSPSRLMSLAWICLVIALAGPRSQMDSPDTQSREGVDILVSMDLSHSMSAVDVYPNRFLYAKSLVESITNQLEINDRLALQAFAGQAHMVSPLSYDRALFRHSLNLLEPDLLPIQGSWLDLAVIGGLTHLSQTAGKARVMVIFTNGAPEFWQPVELPNEAKRSTFVATKRLSETGIKVIIVGVGSPIASTLPESEHSTGKLHVNGLLVQSRLEESRLKKAAQSLEGIYLRADNSKAFMQKLLQEITLPAGNRTESQANLIWQDHAWPFVMIGFSLLLVTFYLLGLLQFSTNRLLNRNTSKINSIVSFSASVLLLGLLSTPQPVFAQALTTKVQAIHQQAFQAYSEKDFELAQSLYDQIPSYEGWFGAGSASYHSADIESAVLYFRQAAWSAPTDTQRAISLFNLGNSYYQANLLAQAIESYQQALVYRPNYDKANHNLLLTQQRKAIEDRGKTKAKIQDGKDEGAKSRDNDGAFYGGQKPSDSNSNEAGFGSDGDSPEGGKSGKQITLPQSGDNTDYRLATGANQLQINSPGSDSLQANAILIEQQNRQRAQAFEHQLQQLEDDQKTLLKRLFEREAGFHAAQDKAHPIPGIQPW